MEEIACEEDADCQPLTERLVTHSASTGFAAKNLPMEPIPIAVTLKSAVNSCRQTRRILYIGCSLNILFFEKILEYSELWSFSIFPWCQCVHTAGR